MRGGMLFGFSLLLGFCQSGVAQDVVSASSGVLQYFEGTVIVDDKPVEHKAGVFPSLKNGSTINTIKGRAELLLTPGVYLRMDENTSVRMVSNSLADTKVELKQGTVILDNLNASGPAPVAINLQQSSVRFPKPGIYRIDADLSELEAFSGEAEVAHEDVPGEKATTKVDASHLYYFGLSMTTSKFGDGAMDEFYDWARNRSEVISQQNEMASAQQDDADDADPNAFAALPGIVPPVGAAPNYSGPLSSTYGSSSLYTSTLSPLFLTNASPFPVFMPTFGILLLPPLRHWPVTGTGIIGTRPPAPVHWPKPTQTGLYTSGFTVHLPAVNTYHPGAITTYRPVTGVPRFTVPSVARPVAVPHVSAPHVAVHR